MDIGIFIVHSFSEPKGYYELEDILKNNHHFNCINYSLQKENFLYDEVLANVSIESVIIENIKKSHIVLIIPNSYFEVDGWRMFEIREAKKLSKPIIYLRKNDGVPELIKPYINMVANFIGDEIVLSIINTIKNKNRHI